MPTVRPSFLREAQKPIILLAGWSLHWPTPIVGGRADSGTSDDGSTVRHIGCESFTRIKACAFITCRPFFTLRGKNQVHWFYYSGVSRIFFLFISFLLYLNYLSKAKYTVFAFLFLRSLYYLTYALFVVVCDRSINYNYWKVAGLFMIAYQTTVQRNIQFYSFRCLQQKWN